MIVIDLTNILAMFLGQYWEWADVLMIRGQWMHDMQQEHHAPKYKQ